jgi:GT2 family glycosyltransferase
MKVAFICVNYNNSIVTQGFINNVLKIQKSNEVVIVVVDNASEITEINDLSKYIFDLNNKNVVLLKSYFNLGYFKGLNLGINYINKLDFDYVVIGNNDIMFDSNFLINLKSKIFDDSVLCIAPNIIRLDGVHQNPHIVKKFSFIQRVYRKIYFSNYYLGILLQSLFNLFKSKILSEDRIGNDVEQEILMGYGACYILRNNFFHHFNELDSPSFLMGEEGILSNQIVKVNGITMYCPELIVNHYDHTSISKLPSKKLYEFNRSAYYHFIENCKYVQ